MSDKTVVIVLGPCDVVEPPSCPEAGKLITPALRERLLANWKASVETDDAVDHVPVVKLFYPAGAHTWLITEMKPEDPDDRDGPFILFGLCDLGMGFPELGYVSLNELEEIKGVFGLGIERDLHFTAQYPLSVYAEAARIADRIVEDDEALKQAAAQLATERETDR